MTNGVPEGWVRNNRYTLSQAATTGVTFTTPADLPSHGLLEVKVTGELLSAGRNNKAGLFMAVNSDGPSKAYWIFPEVPPYLIASNKWSSFEIVDQLNQDAFKERLDRFYSRQRTRDGLSGGECAEHALSPNFRAVGERRGQA